MNFISPFSFLLRLLLLFVVITGGVFSNAVAAQQTPLSSDEFLQLVRQLPKRPGMKEEIIKQLRARGINFRITSGIRSLVATRSGNDADFRRVLEEAERRFLNPELTAQPSEVEATDLLTKASAATLEAAGGMPDFVVKQLIIRAFAHGMTKNWVPQDRLVVGVSYRASGGEKYKLLARNGVPLATVEERDDYFEAGGSSSTGEFVTILSVLFAPESKTEFKAIGTDTVRGRRAIIFEYRIEQPNSKLTLSVARERSVVVGNRGRVWIDRENYRVLRLESIATDIPSDFPITATINTVDYEWVTIVGQGDYLLPSRAVMEMSVLSGRQQIIQTRNDIRFRGYKKYGSEVKIIDEDIMDEEPRKP